MPRVPRAATATPVLPPLSPPFITADDAARWAHARISHQVADKEFGGAILKQGGHYFATTPIADQHLTFDHRILLATDADDNFIAPSGYNCEALYHSHPPDMAQVKLHNPGISDDHASMMISFFSPADLNFIIEHRRSAPTHYLCGPEGSLLKYTTSGSAAEVLLRKRIRGEEPIPASADRESLVWMAAEAGDLRVVVPNARWGGVRGRVKRGWRVNAAVTQAKEEQPFFTQVFDRPEQAVQALTVGEQTFGFVLKHTQSERYVATVPEPLQRPWFSPAALFPARAPGKLRLLSNYRLEAIYYRSEPTPADTPEHESWLYATFPSPAEMVAAIVQSEATQDLQNKDRGLRLYVHTSDLALLELKVPPANEAAGLAKVRDGVFNDNGAQAELMAGTLSPRNYVRRVIGATSLSVVEAGLLWRVLGPVDNTSAVLNSLHDAVLSRLFLNAHDAAVHAHEQIGTRRERAYGGYILKDQEGRFLITEPQPADENPFAHMLFIPANAQGPVIPPETYHLHARYGSHPALSMVAPSWVTQKGWSRDEALINLQIFSAVEIQDVIRSMRPAYLSGATDCLLAYTPSGSAQETLLFNSTERRPAQWVTRLAESGDLQIVQGNALWGPRSPVYSDWTPRFDYAPRLGAPDYATFGAVFGTADEAARDLHWRVHGRDLPAKAYFAFILKHKDKAQYVATEVVGIQAPIKLFNLNSVFSPTADGDYRFPDGFVLHGLFRSQQWQPTGLAASSAWLTRYFVMPTVLYSALYESKRKGQKYNQGKNLPVYFSTQEGALLRFVSLPFNVGSGGVVEKSFEEAGLALESGQLTPQAFVRRWANNGQLYVVRTSPCWDRQGPVSRNWSAYENLTRRRVGPVFASQDDAARYAAAIVGEGRQRAYGGVVLQIPSGGFVATDPLVVPPQGFALNWIYPDSAYEKGLYPPAAVVVARYRSVVPQESQMLLTPTQKAVYQSMLPAGVLANLLLRETRIKREYLFGPKGVILSYELTGAAEEAALKQQLAPLNLVKGDVNDNAVELKLRNGTLLPVDFVTQVAKAGDLRVVKGNDLWSFARRLSGAFQPYVIRTPALEIKQVAADAPCSPLFTQAYDAVRYAQRLASPQPQLRFGYVLKSLKHDAYMVTLPLVRANYQLFEQVFVDGLLPQDYALVGLYLCASTVAIAPSADEMAASFFAPQDVANGVGFVSNLANNGVLPLYLLCADGALLRYVFRKNGPRGLYTLNQEAPSIERRLREGATTVADYVRRLASSGALYVRVRSTVWGKEQAVTAQWRPKAAPWAFVANPHLLSFCGPLFGHADDAARWAAKQLGGFEGKEYLGAVLVPPTLPGFVALDPVEDRHAWQEDTVAYLFWFRHRGFDVTRDHPLFSYAIHAVHAFYKTLPSTLSTVALDQALLGSFVSKDDLRAYVDILTSNRPGAERVYLSSRGGALLQYVPGFTADETRLLSVGSSPRPSVWVSRLQAAGTLNVLETDAFWTRKGTLVAHWQTEDVQVEPDPQAVAYGRDKDEL